MTDLPARLLDVIEHDILPLTRKGVARGDKVFGAAILRKSDLSLVLAGTNAETENPLWHGEVHTLKQFYELPDTPPTDDLIFLSTHEPCTMCMSAITWAGFDNYAYFFSHEDSRDGFGIPHDLKIMKELYALDAGQYRRDNAFFKASAIRPMLNGSPILTAQADRISAAYADLSDAYQKTKSGNSIPLS